MLNQPEFIRAVLEEMGHLYVAVSVIDFLDVLSVSRKRSPAPLHYKHTQKLMAMESPVNWSGILPKRK